MVLERILEIGVKIPPDSLPSIARTDRSIQGLTQRITKARAEQSRLNEEIREMRESGREASVLRERMSALDREIEEATDALNRMNREGNNTFASLARGATGLASSIAGVFAGGALGGMAYYQELVRLRREAPFETDETLQRHIYAARKTGLEDPEYFFEAQTTIQERLGDFIAGNQSLFEEALSKGLDLRRLLNVPREELVDTLVGLLREIPDDEQWVGAIRTFLEDIEGNLITLFAAQPQLYERYQEALSEAPILDVTDLAETRRTLVEFQQTLYELATVIAGTLLPVARPLTQFFSWIIDNVPFASELIGVGLVAALTKVAGGFDAIRLAASHPKVLGIVLTITAIVLTIKWLADQVGGLGNLWTEVWNGMKLTVLLAVRAMVTPLSSLIWLLDKVGQGISFITGADIPRLDITSSLDAEIKRTMEGFGERSAERGGAPPPPTPEVTANQRTVAGTERIVNVSLAPGAIQVDGSQNPQETGEQIAQALTDMGRETTAGRRRAGEVNR